MRSIAEKHVDQKREGYAGYRLKEVNLHPSTLNDTNQNHHDREDQEDMNESAHGIRADKTQKPEDNQDDSNGLEHVAPPFCHNLAN
jgi:hypothetical protein